LWIVRLALRRPYTIAVLSLVMLLLGGLSVARMRVDIFPTIDIPVVAVVWNYPGLSAEEMERRIVLFSERAYSTTVSGISRIESQSISGIGLLKIYFEQGADIGGAMAQITSVSLTASRGMPPGTQPPQVIPYNASNVPVAQLTMSSATLSEQEIFDYGINFVRIRLFTVPGLSTPAPFGGRSRQIMVNIDPVATAAKGLAPQNIVEALLQSNVITPAGKARFGSGEYDVRMNNSPGTVDEFNNIPVKVVNGTPIYLGDVAQISDSYATQTNIVHVNGKRATYLAILRKANASTLAVVDAARSLLPVIRQAAPQGLELKLDFDQSKFVRAAVSGVVHEAVIASVLVSLMILLFLGSWRSMLVVVTSIPLAICTALAGLYATGQTLNIMTLGGLALAIGMLVDDATVEVENIHRNRHLGKGLTRAILDGAQQIAVPALAATLTICIVFFPVGLLEGPAKYLFIPLALSVVFSMMASYLLSRTLVPTMSRMLFEKDLVHGTTRRAPRTLFERLDQKRERMLENLQERYTTLLHAVLRHRVFVLICSVFVTLCAVALVYIVGLDFFPRVDAGQMRLHIRAPLGTRLEAAEDLVYAIENRIRQMVPDHELSSLNSNIGMPASWNLAFIQTDSIGSQDADILIALEPEHAPTLTYMRRIRQALEREFPDVHYYFQPADIISQVLNFGLSAPIDVEIESNDLDKGYALATKLRERMRLIAGTVDVRIPQANDYPAMQLTVDRIRAAQLGLSQRDVAQNLLTSLSSSSLTAPSLWLNPKNNISYFVVVQTPTEKMTQVEDLMATPIVGAEVKDSQSNFVRERPNLAPYLGSIASLAPITTRAAIRHETIQRVIDVQCGVEERDLGSVASDIQREIDRLPKDPAITQIRIRGQSESMFTSFKSLGLGILLASVLVYLLLVVLFQSWLDPFIIMVAVPGALSGVLWMLAITNTTLNVESLMGAIMAIGIAVSNSILLVSYANEVRTEEDIDATEAALRAGRTRLRPVLMTALAMILGMLPMALAIGEASEQNAPLGRAVIGGLLVATVVTLFVVPVVYSLLRRRPPRAAQLDARFEADSADPPTSTTGAARAV